MPHDWRTMTDERFLEHCELETFRGGGPGGQKRNKTSSGVRLVHRPSGLSASATRRRSQAINRREALARLRLAVVVAHRHRVDLAAFTPPDWWRGLGSGLTPRHPDFLRAVGLMLDVMAAAGWSVSAAAAALGVSVGAMVRRLGVADAVWAAVARERAAAGLRPLNRPE